MDEPWNLADYRLWHSAAPMSMIARLGSPSKLLVRGEGCWVEDVSGRRYLDARAGICNVALGYGRQDIAEAMYKQILDLPFACAIRYERPAFTTWEYATALAQRADHLGLTRVRFTQMGSAAVECALLMTQLYFKNRGFRQKRWILSLQGSFHGTTLMTMAASGEPQLHELFGPMPNEFRQIPAPFPRECQWCSGEGKCNGVCVENLENTIQEMGPDNVAALIVEPVMGTRVIILPQTFLQGARSLCNRYDILLIFDEVVTAFGRIGSLFAADHFKVSPDIMCLAKGITGGYAPLGAVLAAEHVFQAFDAPRVPHFANGSSTDGHPVSCAAALAVLQAFERDSVVSNVHRQGERAFAQLTANLRDNPLVADVRGLGLYIGIQLIESDGSPVSLTRLRKLRMEHERRQVLTHYTADVIILMPPLTIGERETDLVCAVVSETLNEMAVQTASIAR